MRSAISSISVLAAAAFACVAFVACAGRDRPHPQAASSSAPPDVYAKHGVLRIVLSAVVNPHTLQPEFSYAGRAGTAPTLRVAPGDTIEVAYHNALPANDAMGNATNLHFHGLVVSPNAPSDETLRTMALPGQTLHYVVHVGARQQPGLYWYHPHAHGNTFRQVGLGGMSGAIVVSGIERAAPEVTALPERLLVVRDVADALDSNVLIAHPELAAHENEGGAANVPCRQTAGTHLTVNGSEHDVIASAPGDSQFVRLLNATATRFLDISLGHATLRLVALDGVPLGAYPGAKTEVSFRHLVVPPGGRVEFVAAGVRPGDALTTACYDAGPDGDADPAGVLATFVSDEAANAPPLAASPPASAGSDAALHENSLAAPPAPAAHRTVTFTESNRNGASLFKVNGSSYDPARPSLFAIRSGTVERWTIVNKSHEAHAFHIHQVHFALLSIDGKPVPRYWRDTFTTPPDSRSELLVDFRDPIVRGTFVFHCHLLDHEDGGMMAKITVQ